MNCLRVNICLTINLSRVGGAELEPSTEYCASGVTFFYLSIISIYHLRSTCLYMYLSKHLFIYYRYIHLSLSRVQREELGEPSAQHCASGTTFYLSIHHLPIYILIYLLSISSYLGCGEQNLVNLLPNIVLLEYLETVGRGSNKATENKSKNTDNSIGK